MVGYCLSKLALFITSVRYILVPCHRGPKYKNARRNEQIHPHPPPSANPFVLPTTLIDPRPRPEAEQPEDCHFQILKLPVELRLFIYEHLIGGRLISVRLLRSGFGSPLLQAGFRPRYYHPIDDLARAPANDVFLAEPISLSLLLVCRTVYTEALPILHHRNTFYFWACDLETIARSALGAYCFPDIRSVHVVYDSAAYNVIPVLKRMRGLERLAIQFSPDQLAIHFPSDQLLRVEQTGSDPHRAVLESAWARDILGLRSLRRLELWFTPNGQQEHLVYNQNLAQKFRQLMVGQGADERYQVFLEEYERKCKAWPFSYYERTY
ncbi:hypothetical protein K438DRAFT_1757117 [Mycena galopus ATCC 62051]|nr:hypothetical protein K438DRAFT_1757117 [Mycena galopus ATCC 62051]